MFSATDLSRLGYGQFRGKEIQMVQKDSERRRGPPGKDTQSTTTKYKPAHIWPGKRQKACLPGQEGWLNSYDLSRKHFSNIYPNRNVAYLHPPISKNSLPMCKQWNMPGDACLLAPSQQRLQDSLQAFPTGTMEITAQPDIPKEEGVSPTMRVHCPHEWKQANSGFDHY